MILYFQSTLKIHLNETDIPNMGIKELEDEIMDYRIVLNDIKNIATMCMLRHASLLNTSQYRLGFATHLAKTVLSKYPPKINRPMAVSKMIKS